MLFSKLFVNTYNNVKIIIIIKYFFFKLKKSRLLFLKKLEMLKNDLVR